MRTKLGLFSVFSLLLLMLVPAHAAVQTVNVDKETFSIGGKFIISGTTDDAEGLQIVASMKGQSGEKLLKSAFGSNGTFTFAPIHAKNIFKSQGLYTIIIFAESQPVANGTIIKMKYEGNIISLIPNYELILNTITNQTLDETQKLTFTASVTDPQIINAQYLLRNQPNGATINKDTGAFSWTPNSSQAGKYVFDIIVRSGPLETKESITITVNDRPLPTTTHTSPITNPVPQELGIASFVNKTKDPQHYVDRYNNEKKFKDWFDGNYPMYDSIYHAVGLEKPLAVPAEFVKSNLGAQHYVDRYNNEKKFKDWFDGNYPMYDSIYHAVGLDEPGMTDPNMIESGIAELNTTQRDFGKCGNGTKLVGDMCVVVDAPNGGGCLIATATYGSEMTPQVQFLREIRDNQLMETKSGMSFMIGFNQLYYSFSPYIADMERENPVFKEMVKIGIAPLLSSLSVMSYAESESQVLGYGIGVILMNLGMYVGIPIVVVFEARKYVKNTHFKYGKSELI